MDSKSQTSVDDITIEFGRSCSCSTLSDTTIGVSCGCCAKEMVEKLLVQLKEKDKELEEIKIQLEEKDKALEANKEENKELLGRAVAATHDTDELKTELAIAHNTIDAFQKAFWKSFPSPHLRYSIKAPSGVYLYADVSGYLCSSKGDHSKGYFKFTKNSDGTFSICSGPHPPVQEQGKTHVCCVRVVLPNKSASNYGFGYVLFPPLDHGSKLALVFHPEQDKQQPGILVDIFSLEKRCYLSAKVDRQNRLVATHAPGNKFLILAEGVE